MKYLISAGIGVCLAISLHFVSMEFVTWETSLSWAGGINVLCVFLTHLVISQLSKERLRYWQHVFFGWISTIFGFAFFFFYLVYEHGFPPERTWGILSKITLAIAGTTFVLSLILSVIPNKGRLQSKRNESEVLDDPELQL